jgi:hypothetical protein
MGGRLPPERRDWVRHDLMDAGWRWRAARRSVLQALLPALVLAVLPGPAWIHLGAPLLVLLTVLFVAVCYADELRDRRLRQHDLPIPYREPPPRGY